MQQTLRRVNDHLLVVKGDAVFGGGHHLDLKVALVLVHTVAPAVAGVIGVELVVIDDGGAGEDAVLILFDRGRKRDRFAAPRHQVGRGDMTPVHRPPNR